MSKKELILLVEDQQINNKLTAYRRRSVNKKQKQLTTQLKQQVVMEQIKCYKD